MRSSYVTYVRRGYALYALVIKLKKFILCLLCTAMQSMWTAMAKQDLQASFPRAPALVAYLQERVQLLQRELPLLTVLIDLVHQYEQCLDSCFIPCFSRDLSGDGDPEKATSLSLFELDVSGSLRCRPLLFQPSLEVASPSIYPPGWDRNKWRFFHQHITQRLTQRSGYGAVSCESEYSHQAFRSVCGVHFEILAPLTELLCMRSRLIHIDSEEYDKYIKNSSMMIDPYSLTLCDLAKQINKIYVQLEGAVIKPEFQSLDYELEQWAVTYFIKEYKQSHSVRRLAQTEPGITSVLFFDTSPSPPASQ